MSDNHVLLRTAVTT